MRRIAVSLTVLALLGLVGSSVLAADKDQDKKDETKAKEIKPSMKFDGSVADEDLQKLAPKNGFITDEKEFKKLFEAWKVAEKVPEVNFKKEVVVVETTKGGKLTVGAGTLTEKGDLKVLGLATRDLKPGFRYAILVFPREDVKTINGKELPKE
jgi:hypothetical protein